MRKFTRSIVGIFVLAAVAAQPFAASAQKRGAAVAKKTSPASAAAKCSGAWTGSISYKRTQSMTNSKTEDRISGRGKDTTNWEMKYDYSGRVTVSESLDRPGSSDAKATVSHNFTSVERVDAVEKNSCDRGKTWRDMRGTSISKTQTTGNGSTNANVSVGVSADGTYKVGVAMSQIKGQTTGSQSSEYSGQCVPKEGKKFEMPATETSVDGNSLTSDGTHRINPDDPNRLSGSFTKTWENVTETITWNLQKCGAPLRLIDLKFDDMVFPNWNEWRELNEQTGTIDGNFVRMKAKILNASGETKFAEVVFKETFKGDKWDGSRPDSDLKDTTVSVRLEPGEEREVEAMWDTSGYAWYDDGRPRLVQRVKAELLENNKKTDEMTKNVKVAPKPLVLVHGLWSNWRAWEAWQNILTTSHSYDWKAFPVGEKPGNGVMNTGGEFLSTSPTNTIAQNAAELKNYIDYAQRDRNAWHVDIVAHSMGGLISRDYINRLMPLNGNDGRPQVTRLIMLGTPNMGSPCADVMDSTFSVLGKRVEAVRQLRQDVMVDFNKATKNRKGVKFSVLAGDPLPTMCKTIVWNDGVVPVPSAIWEIADNAKSKNVHTDLTGTVDFSAFVKPRLAVGPKGNHNPEVSAPTGLASIYKGSEPRYYGMSELSGIDLPFTSVADKAWAKEVKLSAKEKLEIEVPVDAATNFGITFMAAPDVSVTLIDDKGAVVGSNLAGKPESRGWFRSIFIDKPVASGKWKLRIENTSDRSLDAVFTSWANAVK